MAQPRGGWLSVGVPSVLGVLQKVELPNGGRMAVALGFRGLGSGAQGLGSVSCNQVTVRGLP